MPAPMESSLAARSGSNAERSLSSQLSSSCGGASGAPLLPSPSMNLTSTPRWSSLARRLSALIMPSTNSSTAALTSPLSASSSPASRPASSACAASTASRRAPSSALLLRSASFSPASAARCVVSSSLAAARSAQRFSSAAAAAWICSNAALLLALSLSTAVSSPFRSCSSVSRLLLSSRNWRSCLRSVVTTVRRRTSKAAAPPRRENTANMIGLVRGLARVDLAGGGSDGDDSGLLRLGGS
mmetsp:Transcript_45742/g.117010  ORF Transcript_45742/g.117010 Transcript_45742/m.117010 type:complete len:242 (-) Transcript_45742:116-841(-)